MNSTTASNEALLVRVLEGTVRGDLTKKIRRDMKLEEYRDKDVIVDFGNAPWSGNSVGAVIDEFIEIHGDLKKRGNKLFLVSISDGTRKMISDVDVGKILTVVSSTDEVTALRERAVAANISEGPSENELTQQEVESVIRFISGGCISTRSALVEKLRQEASRIESDCKLDKDLRKLTSD